MKLRDVKGKYIFWDIDGTLAEYRFNGHVADKDGTNNGMSLQEIEEHIFLTRKPSEHMQKVVKQCKAKENIIMGHCQVEQERIDKNIWLDKYYPMMKNRLLTFENKPKYQSILEYCKKNQIDLKDVVYVDDVIPFLRDAERNDIKSYHISSFLDWKNTAVICAVSACGKTYLSIHAKNFSVLDIDTSGYSKANKNWYKDYVDDIEDKLGTVDFIMCGHRSIIKEELKKRDIDFYEVAPAQGEIIKQEWFGRFLLRDNSHIKDFDSWLEKLKKNYDKYISTEEISRYNPKGIYLLKENEYISDIINDLYVRKELD